jgi:hypothetical protein
LEAGLCEIDLSNSWITGLTGSFEAGYSSKLEEQPVLMDLLKVVVPADILDQRSIPASPLFTRVLFRDYDLAPLRRAVHLAG